MGLRGWKSKEEEAQLGRLQADTPPRNRSVWMDPLGPNDSRFTLKPKGLGLRSEPAPCTSGNQKREERAITEGVLAERRDLGWWRKGQRLRRESPERGVRSETCFAEEARALHWLLSAALTPSCIHSAKGPCLGLQRAARRWRGSRQRDTGPHLLDMWSCGENRC